MDIREAGTGQIAQALRGCHSMQQEVIRPYPAFRVNRNSEQGKN